MHASDVIRFMVENREAFITFTISLLAVVKLTAWGKAQSAALDAVVGVIEQLGARDVKAGVSETAGDLSAGAQDAIADSVAKADPKKNATSLIIRMLREVLRGI